MVFVHTHPVVADVVYLLLSGDITILIHIADYVNGYGLTVK
jgi:hypothetical protein